MTQWSKSSAYSRFIPSEEINAVSEWRFANVDGTPHVEEIEPQLPIGPSPEEIAAQVEAARQLAFDEGYALGHAEGCQTTREELAEPTRLTNEQARQQFQSIQASMHTQLAQVHDQMAQAVLQMACDLARQVLRRELTIDPQALQPVLTEALALLHADTVPVTVRLNPEDFAAIDTTNAAAGSPGSPRFVPDATITPGGCVLEAPGAGVDATVETRWSRAIANLGLNAAWEPDHAVE
jgi:flagellar assembly protein FliH